MEPNERRETARIVAAAFVVTAALAAFLRAADTVPALLRGEPRGVVRHSSVEEAERELGTRLVLPRDVPPPLSWPPYEIRSTGGRQPSTAVRLRGGSDKNCGIVIFQALSPAGVSPRLLPEASPFHAVTVSVGGRPVTLSTVQVGADGALLELSLMARGRRIVLRGDVPGDVVVKVAEGLR